MAILKLSEANPILRSLLSDISSQQQWRGEAAVDLAWRDNHQWTKEQIVYLESLGLNPLQINLIAPAMESVTGYEAKHRVDWMISDASEEHEEMAEAVNHKLNDEMQLADANTACSDAYELQAGVGIGWIHIARNPDPLAPGKLLIEDVHRDEIWWDMRGRSIDLRRDCRWLARRKFFDKDSAKGFLGKQHEELIDFTFSDWRTIDISEEGPHVDWFTSLNEYTDPMDMVLDNNSGRPRVAIYEVYYKVVEPRDLIATQDGAVMEFRKDNPIHLDILASGFGVLHRRVPIHVCRVAWFVGPHLIWDGPSPEPHNHFPYVPFFGCREDGNNCPVGLIRRMRGPQEEYNRAAMETQRILRSRRIEKDHDALQGMTDAQAIFEINRTDGVINKKHGREFQVIREWEKIAVLEGICKRAREEINAASGIYATFQGQTEADQSGIAVESIAELGAQSLGKINANYQHARRCVGDLAFAHVVTDIGERRVMVSIPQEIGQQKKQVTLNDGLNNRVSLLRAQVAMQDIHTSAGYKQHTHMRLTNIIDKIPDDFKGVLLPFWLESSEMPKKEQAIKLINKKLGYESDENKREEQEAIQAQEAAQLKQLEIQKFVAEVEDLQAGAKQKNAQAANATADALKKRIETAQLIRNFKLMEQGVIPFPGSPAGSTPAAGNRRMMGAAPGRNNGGPPPDQRKALPPGASGVATPTPAGNAPAPSLPGMGMQTMPREASTP